MKPRIIILGGGESGIGAALLALDKGFDVFLSDAGQLAPERRRELEQNGIAYEEGRHSKELLFSADLVVKSPGIPDRVSIVQAFRDAGVPVISEIEFAFRYIPEEAKVVAITGTNGKTTTTLLTHHLFEKAGLKAALGGNVGNSLAGLVREGGFDYYIVEVSSFQLDGIVTFKPDVAVLLNITPDHLDRYNQDFDKYVSAKFRITENLTQEECFIYALDSEPITEELSRRRVEATLFAMSATRNERIQAYMEEEHLIFNFQFKDQDHKHRIPLSEISLIGKHNMMNTMAAVLSALCLNVPMNKLLDGLKNFKNAPHRMELVATIKEVAFINDSKATNVDAAYYAIDGLKEGVIWIAGGVDKGNNYDQLTDLVEEKVKGIICLGSDNQRLRAAFSGLVEFFEETTHVNEAVRWGLTRALHGQAVLLSPACASFDLFTNYEDRGNQFKEAVWNLKKGEETAV